MYVLDFKVHSISLKKSILKGISLGSNIYLQTVVQWIFTCIPYFFHILLTPKRVYKPYSGSVVLKKLKPSQNIQIVIITLRNINLHRLSKEGLHGQWYHKLWKMICVTIHPSIWPVKYSVALKIAWFVLRALCQSWYSAPVRSMQESRSKGQVQVSLKSYVVFLDRTLTSTAVLVGNLTMW